MDHAANRASMRIDLGLSNAKRYITGANVPFLSRVLRRVSSRKLVSLSIRTGKSVRVSSRRAGRSINVALKVTLRRTLNSHGKVAHFNRFITPLSRSLIRITLSFSKQPRLDCNLRVPARHINACSARLIHRFFITIIGRDRVALRVHRLSNVGSRRVVRTAFGTFTQTVQVTIRMSPHHTRLVPDSGKIV